MPRRRTPVPLPVRDGLNPTRLRLPDDAPPAATVLAYLLGRFPDDAARLREKVAAGEVVDGAGRPVDEATPVRGTELVFLYRDPPEEPPAPRATVLHRDENLLVVDKPHGLATIPRGAYVARSVLVQLRRELDLPGLAPVHRLDRGTAGVLVLTVRREVRGAYQQLFDARAVRKGYLAVAPVRADLELPRTVRSRIVKERGVLQAREVDGPVNAETDVELAATDGTSGLGLYRLTPRTGRTHQLRVHLAGLGVPIVGDPLYPVVRDEPLADGPPLQLLARTIAFTDPFDGTERTFTSRRTLAAWPRWEDDGL